MIVLWNDRFVESSEMQIPFADATYLRGEGLFETIRVVGGKPLFLPDHARRLADSAGRLSLLAPTLEFLEVKIRELVLANHLSEARVRVTLGENCLMTAEPLEAEMEMVSVSTIGERYPVNERSPIAGIKCTSYAENMALLRLAGVGEVLRANTRGELCEGCVSNVFFVKDGKVFTPSLDTGCLPGVMRQQVMAVAEVEEGCWPYEWVREADEIWLSNTIRRLRFVNELDGESRGEPSELFHEIRSRLP